MSEETDDLDAADWPGLVNWMAAHPLPAGTKDLKMNMVELSRVIGISTNRLKAWLTQPENPMPFVVQGTNGREYVLQFSWYWAWKEHNDAQDKKRETDLARLQGQLFGIETDQPEQGLSPKQVREVAEAKIKYAEAARMLGTLTEIGDVYRLLDQVFVKMRNSAMGMSDRLERELGLTPPQARQVYRAMEEMLSSLIEELQESAIGTGFTPNLEMNAQLVNET